MIEVRHPQAVLVYTSVGEHRMPSRSPRSTVFPSWSKSRSPSLSTTRSPSAAPPPLPYSCPGQLRNHLVFEQPRRHVELQNGSLGKLRRVVVEDGHQGPKEIGCLLNF